MSGRGTSTRSPLERTLIGLVLFQGITGTAGGAVLTWSGSGMPDEWLAGIPFDSWVWPGVILGVGLGLAPLVIAYGLLRRPRWAALAPIERATGHHWSWVASVALGVGLLAWIVVELVMIAAFHPIMQPLYLAVGVGILATAASPPVRRATMTDRQERRVGSGHALPA